MKLFTVKRVWFASAGRALPFFLLLVFCGGLSVAGEPAREAFVTNQPGDSVTVVDLTTLSAVGEIKVPGRPAGVAVSPDKQWVYVTAPEGKALYVIDARKRTVLKRIEIGEGPLGVVSHPDNGMVFVADWYRHKVYEIDPAAGQTVRTFDVGKSPSGLAVSPDGARLYTTDRDDNTVSVIDLETGQRSSVIPVGTRPFGIKLNSAGDRAYTANVKSNDVTVIDLQKGTVVATVPVGRRPYAVALTATHAFVTDQYAATVSVVELASHKRVHTINVGDYPEGIASDPGQGVVYVACWDSDVLQRIDAKTFKVTGEVAVGQGPRAFGPFLR